MFGAAGRPRCAKSYLVTVTADAVTEQVKLGFQDGFQIGNGIDHGFHRLVGQQDGLRCNVVKGQHFLQLLTFCIENVRQSGLL